MKFTKALTIFILLLSINVFSQTCTISGIISGTAAEDPYHPKFLITFFDSANNNTIIKDSSYNGSNGYSITIRIGAKGKLIISRPGFISDPTEKIFDDYILTNQININFDTQDTTKPEIDSIQIPDTLIVNVTDTIKFKPIDNSTFTIQNIIYTQFNNDPWEEIGKTGKVNNLYRLRKIPITFEKIGNYRIKIKAIDSDSNTTEKISDLYVIDTISPTINISSPNSGEKWKIGTNHNITWTASDNIGIISRAIYYSYDNQNWNLIDSSNNNTGTYSWLIPNTISNTCKIKISVYDECLNTAFDVSENFEIIDSIIPDTIPPTINITNLDNVIQKNTAYSIEWDATDDNAVSAISIYFSNDSGSTYNLIDSSNSNPGIFSWDVPDSVYHSCYIKIFAYDLEGNKDQDISNIFEINDYEAPQVIILEPTNDSIIKAGSKIIVRFNATDNEDRINYYKVYLSTDSGSTYIPRKEGPYFGGEISKEIFTNQTNISEKCIVKIEISDENGNIGIAFSDTFSIVIPTETSHVSNLPKKFNINITEKSFIIEMEKTDKVHISLVSMNGRIIINKTEILKTGRHNIYKGDIAQGIYILRVRRIDKTITKKIL